jgi:hypothetical protein
MITVVVIFSRVEIPTTYLIPIDAIVGLLSNESTPVVFRQKAPIRLLPGLILDIGGCSIFIEGRKHAVFDVYMTARKRNIVKTPKGPKFAERG